MGVVPAEKFHDLLNLLYIKSETLAYTLGGVLFVGAVFSMYDAYKHRHPSQTDHFIDMSLETLVKEPVVK